MEIYKPENNLPRAFICDIDGTVALHGPGYNDRGHYEYESVSRDAPNYPVIHVVQAVINTGEYIPIFVSGRMEFSRSDTAVWMDSYFDFPSQAGIGHLLFMRADGDHRPDYIIKAEIFDNFIRNMFNVEFTFDDRNQVVNLWRSAGIPCLQVAEGNF